jgi:2-hydroxy-3-keto-5-methylthiopentenyl-1-phosphate phosphatase
MNDSALQQLEAIIPTARVVVLCEFDGTISSGQSLGYLSRTFAAGGFEHV